MFKIDDSNRKEYHVYRENKGDTIFKVRHIGFRGELLITADKITVYNLWIDYENLPVSIKTAFNKENPYWADFFGRRND